MTKLLVDSDLKSRLHDLREHLEMCDASGRVVGHVIPADDYNRLMCRIASLHISDEELERRLHEPGGRTLTEILQSLPAS
jgi:hypothetical protein